MSNTIFQGACQVTNEVIVKACNEYKQLYDRLLVIYNEDMDKLKKITYKHRYFFGLLSEERTLHYDFLQLGAYSWRSLEDTYVTYWKDGKGIHWTSLQKAVFRDGYQEVYYQLKKLSSMNSELVLINPDQANFINKDWK